ncbi:hypothetical protein Igag_1251 [Ignisphaera aggregans DSM 17230]|uniref:Uncharacterized protein n=1 Tax=Ignisphaera aggregans (strain DSM 17230 / JCM 13409 / AQ1.S1) TaxID=583356 RepID=E0SPK1_IGNAA|nr:hypothetical protein Igag_1251 [Ignisphaera aggregans DSM 17230]
MTIGHTYWIFIIADVYAIGVPIGGDALRPNRL